MLRRFNTVMVLMTTSNSPFSAAAIFAATTVWQRFCKEFYLMKRALICALLTLAMAAPGTALYAQAQQDNGQGGGRAHGMQMSPDQRMQHMTKMLNLSADQQEKIKPILESESQQMQTLHQDTSLTREQRFDKMREIRENTMTQIKPILSADQQAKWEQMRRKPMPPEAGQGSQQSAPPPQASPY